MRLRKSGKEKEPGIDCKKEKKVKIPGRENWGRRSSLRQEEQERRHDNSRFADNERDRFFGAPRTYETNVSVIATSGEEGMAHQSTTRSEERR